MLRALPLPDQSWHSCSQIHPIVESLFQTDQAPVECRTGAGLEKAHCLQTELRAAPAKTSSSVGKNSAKAGAPVELLALVPCRNHSD
mmetsp:Transcript_183270/g.581141  ORF Transcript_183270/g.581141 Transcript_183270/m.581141 type:complete len:87 (+) Transcript_183270:930-1190(+)